MVGGGLPEVEIVFLDGGIGKADEILGQVQRPRPEGVEKVEVDYLIASVEGQVGECLGRESAHGGLQNGVEVDLADFFASPEIGALDVGRAAYLDRRAGERRNRQEQGRNYGRELFHCVTKIGKKKILKKN